MSPGPHMTPLQGKVRLSKAGAHYFDRCTGLNVLLDDVNVPTRCWARAPRYVSLALTNACDLECPHCYAPKQPSRLDIGRVVQWLMELDAEGTLGVGFGGGEPTLYPGFANLCRRAAEQTRLAITFTTHGHCLTKRLAAELRGHVHFLRISVDGVGETYERLRGRPFDRLPAQLDLVRSISRFGINMVVNAETISQLDTVADFARDQGATELLMLPEEPAQGRRGLDAVNMHRLEAWIAHTPRRMRLAISKFGATAGMPVADPYPKENPLDGHAHVDAFGVIKSNAFTQTGVPIKDSIMEALDRLRVEEELT
jgi:MoaA/NifB/PqqE/SkfB family radical SAM enzyme